MLSVLLVFGLATWACLALGAAVVTGLRRLSDGVHDRAGPFDLLLLGLGLLTALVSWATLIGPIDPTARVAVFTLTLVAGFWGRRELGRAFGSIRATLSGLGWPLIVAAALVILLGLERSASSPYLYDTGLYHAQSIRWIEEYGVAPGLANLHTRFGFNSAWFSPLALFAVPGANGEATHPLNGWLFGCVALWLVARIRHALNGPHPIAAFGPAALLAAVIPLLMKWLCAPTPDTPACLLLWTVVLMAYDGGWRENKVRAVTLVTVGVLVVTVKLSAIPILVVSGAALLSLARQDRRWAAASGGLAVFAALAFAARSFIISGYPIWPSPIALPSLVDWQVPFALSAAETGLIRSWAILPNEPRNEVLAMTAAEWMPLWFERMSWMYQGIVVFAAISALVVVIAGLKRVRLPVVAELTMVVGAVFWFFVAPDVRFGLGFLTPLAFLPLTLRAPAKLARLRLPVAIAALLAVQAASVYYRYPEWRGTVTERIVLPSGYPIASTQRTLVDGREVWVGNEYACWYHPLPCTEQTPAIAFRGTSLKDGFRPRTLEVD